MRHVIASGIAIAFDLRYPMPIAIPTVRPKGLERAKGVEPSTCTLARCRSTTELRSHREKRGNYAKLSAPRKFLFLPILDASTASMSKAGVSGKAVRELFPNPPLPDHLTVAVA